MAPTAILPRPIVRKNFDMGRLVAYAFGAVNERGLRSVKITGEGLDRRAGSRLSSRLVQKP